MNTCASNSCITFVMNGQCNQSLSLSLSVSLSLSSNGISCKTKAWMSRD